MSESHTPIAVNRYPYWVILTFLIWLAGILTYLYVQQIDLPFIEARRQLQNQILQGVADRPYQERLLVPYLTHGLEQLFRSVTGNDSFGLAYIIYDFLAIFLSLFALSSYLRLWYDEVATILGCLVASISMLVGFRDHYFQPWSLLEPALFAFGLWCIARGKFTWLVLLLVIATFNRQTGIILVVAYFVSWASLPNFWLSFKQQYSSQLARTLILFVVWSAIFGWLSWHYQSLPRAISIQEIFIRSTEISSIKQALLQIVLFLGPFWIFIILGYRRAQPFIQRTAWLIPIYMGLYLVYNLWYEVRLLTSLYAVFIPLGMAYWFSNER